jgi:hypothetical protein
MGNEIPENRYLGVAMLVIRHLLKSIGTEGQNLLTPSLRIQNR